MKNIRFKWNFIEKQFWPNTWEGSLFYFQSFSTEFNVKLKFGKPTFLYEDVEQILKQTRIQTRRWETFRSNINDAHYFLNLTRYLGNWIHFYRYEENFYVLYKDNLVSKLSNITSYKYDEPKPLDTSESCIVIVTSPRSPKFLLRCSKIIVTMSLYPRKRSRLKQWVTVPHRTEFM